MPRQIPARLSHDSASLLKLNEEDTSSDLRWLVKRRPFESFDRDAEPFSPAHRITSRIVWPDIGDKGRAAFDAEANARVRVSRSTLSRRGVVPRLVHIGVEPSNPILSVSNLEYRTLNPLVSNRRTLLCRTRPRLSNPEMSNRRTRPILSNPNGGC